MRCHKITEYIPHLVTVFPAIRLNNKLVRLFFNTSLLVMNTRIDMILGVPFMRYWNITSHHCNGSMIVTGPSGHHAIIPLIPLVLWNRVVLSIVL